MKKMIWAVLMSAALPALAAEPKADFVVWPSAELKEYHARLAPRVDAQKLAMESLGHFGNHSLAVAHREKDGVAEVHETQTDIFVVQSGRATLLAGGEMVSPKTTAPGEVRAPSIKGGERKALVPGDVVHISPRVPHQLFVAEGEEFTYFVIKVAAPR